jgi:hypothetical protein
LFAVVGASTIVAASVSQLLRGRRIVTGALVLALAIGLELLLAASMSVLPYLRDGHAALDDLRHAQSDPRPIAVADDRAFMELWFYRLELRNPIVHLIGSRTLSSVFGKRYQCAYTLCPAPSGADPCSRHGGFLASNPAFLLVTDGHDWLLTHLVKSGYIVKAKYAIRTPANESLERDIAELLTRPVGRPSHKPGGV